MRFTPLLRSGMLCLVAAAAAACSDSPTGPGTEPTPTPTSIKLQSDAGDYIGGGRSYEYTHANATLTLTVQGGLIHVGVDGDEWWFADFQLPGGGSRVVKGTYGSAQRYPFNGSGQAGISWSGEGRGCNTITGSFTVDSVAYVADSLKVLDLRFEQHCEGGAPALRGTIQWRADDKTAPAGPVTPIPASLWKPAAGSVPATGNYVYFQSDAGDYIGGGQTRTFTSSAGLFMLPRDGGVYVGFGPYSGEFYAMRGLTQLKPGYYPDLQRWPFHNPAKGGLSVSGDGRGCNTLTGWFVVDRVVYSGNDVTELDLRFEQHCEGGAPALRGAVRWRA
jgi:hypothetical protein